MLQWMLGAATLNTQVYREIEHDRTATPKAMLVVALAAVAGGVAAIGDVGPLGVVLSVIWGIIGWALWAWITYVVGTKVLPTPQTEADWGQMARVLGFAQTPGLLRVLGVIPGVGPLIVFIATLWQLVAMVVAVREGLDYTSNLRAVGVVLIGFFPYIIVYGLLRLIAPF